MKTILSYIFLLFVGVCAGAGAVDILVEPFISDNKDRLIEKQENYIAFQDSLIDALRDRNDSLRITREELDYVAMLLRKSEKCK